MPAAPTTRRHLLTTALPAPRPFDTNKSTNETGTWRWLGLPQSLLVNGRGFYGDCAIIGGPSATSPQP